MSLPSPEEVAGAQTLAAEAAARARELSLSYEFATFQCACLCPAGLDEARAGSFREAVRRALRDALRAEWPGRRVDPDRPEVLIEVDPDGAGVRLVAAPVLVAGRYRKLTRGLSQTAFHCRRCRGRGCPECGGSGRLVPEAVEDFVRPPLERALAGEASAFHGSGREDVDVRMLGTGRPFVVSVQGPRRRSIDAGAAAREVAESSGGRVEVTELRVVGPGEMRRVTTEHGEKEYRVVVAPAEPGVPLPHDSGSRVLELSGAPLSQRTPQRVARRRADRVRVRTLLAVEVEEAAPHRLVLRVRTDPGTYVKELVSGDAGRTVPSVSAALGVPCVCAELDVLGVR